MLLYFCSSNLGRAKLESLGSLSHSSRIWDLKPSFSLERFHAVIVCVISNVIGVNASVSNILMSIQIVSTWINVIRFATAILTVQFQTKLKENNK